MPRLIHPVAAGDRPPLLLGMDKPFGVFIHGVLNGIACPGILDFPAALFRHMKHGNYLVKLCRDFGHMNRETQLIHCRGNPVQDTLPVIGEHINNGELIGHIIVQVDFRAQGPKRPILPRRDTLILCQKIFYRDFPL